MGIRFRKSTKMGKFARINIGKKGVGFSLGTKGARVSFGSDGKIRRTHSIPGTGIYYTDTISDNVSSASQRAPSRNATKTNFSPGLFLLIVFSLSVVLFVFVRMNHEPQKPPPPGESYYIPETASTPALSFSSYLTSFLEPGDTQPLCIEYNSDTIDPNDVVLYCDNPNVVTTELNYQDNETIVYIITACTDGYANIWASTSDGSAFTDNIQFIVESSVSYPNTYPHTQTTYVLNTSTKVVHKTSCSSVDSISPENKRYCSDLSSSISEGYSLCGRCNPN